MFNSAVNPVIIALILSTGTVLAAKSFGYVSIKEWNTDMISVSVFIVLAIVFFVSKKLWKKKLSAIQIILIGAVLGVAVSMIAEKIAV